MPANVLEFDYESDAKKLENLYSLPETNRSIDSQHGTRQNVGFYDTRSDANPTAYL